MLIGFPAKLPGLVDLISLQKMSLSLSVQPFYLLAYLFIWLGFFFFTYFFMWPSTSGASRLCAKTATFEPKLYAQTRNPTHRFGVSCSGSAADCEKSH